MPIDLHILGASSDGSSTSFNAQGFYLNDDGLTLNLTNKQNQYSIKA